MSALGFSRSRFSNLLVYGLLAGLFAAGAPAVAQTISRDALGASEGRGEGTSSPPCICPATLPEWKAVSDTMKVPEEILETMTISRMIVCEHGMFFSSLVKSDGGRPRAWWVGIKLPTPDEYRYCLQLQGELEGEALELALEKDVAEATVRYNEVREEMRTFLGSRYRERKLIRFDEPDRPSTASDCGMGLVWRGREIVFQLVPNLYFH